mgnify:CR=1 FL=1
MTTAILATIGHFLSPILAWLWRVLRVSIPVPLAAVVVVAGWWWIDRTSAVRHAVDKAVTELVAGEELAAAKALAEGEQKLREFAEERARAAREAAAAEYAAREDLARKEAETAAELENANDQIAELLARPAPAGCRADADLLGRLRNAR